MSPEELPLARLYRWERERPQHIYLSQPFGGGKMRDWTWAQAGQEIRRMARYLEAQHWEPGSHIAILSKNCAWWMMADLAIWMAGHVTVPIYPSLRPQSVRQILQHSDAVACFIGATDEREMASSGVPDGLHCIGFPNAPTDVGRSWDGVVSGTPPMEGDPVRLGEDLATIFYTSGTTGVPKGVMHSFDTLSALAKALNQVIDLSLEHRVLSYLPLAHIVERTGMEVPAMLYGWHVFFTEGLESFLVDLRRAQPSIFLSVPRLLFKFRQGVYEKVPQKKVERLMRIPLVRRLVGRKILRQLGLDKTRYAACGAAPLPVDLLLWYRNLGLNLMEGYGLTEALITHLPKPGNVRPGYVGTPLPTVEAVRTEQGELLLRSPFNMLGYYKDSEGTRAIFTDDGFIRTGDLVEIDTDQQLKIIGRVKEQFKTSKGKYVSPAPIESRLAAHPAVESCCLMGAGLPSPFALVVLTAEALAQKREEVEDSLAHLLKQMNEELNPHERLRFLAVVQGPWTITNGLMTPTLKLRRSSVEAQYQAFVDTWQHEGRPVVWEK